METAQQTLGLRIGRGVLRTLFVLITESLEFADRLGGFFCSFTFPVVGGNKTGMTPKIAIAGGMGRSNSRVVDTNMFLDTVKERLEVALSQMMADVVNSPSIHEPWHQNFGYPAAATTIALLTAVPDLISLLSHLRDGMIIADLLWGLYSLP
ncbi:hypothetical protein Ancab_036908 [Ancistrocladus abbreviatus]